MIEGITTEITIRTAKKEKAMKWLNKMEKKGFKWISSQTESENPNPMLTLKVCKLEQFKG